MRNAFFLATFLISSLLHAQQFSGTVVSEFNQPLQDVYIENQRTQEHTHSNELGRFELLNTRIGDTVMYRSLGYSTQLLEVETMLDNKIVLKLKPVELKELVVASQKNLTSTVSKIDLEIAPVTSSQEILRKVPGLFIGQHAGGGKAEQIFLRGFDIDHGTDVAIDVDGMPVNMVSHAHGQGYSDLHFLIPETIDVIDFGKGAYYADKGDFNTAGYVSFKTKDYLQKNSLSLSLGQFNTLRTVGMFNLLDKKSTDNAYLAVEYLESDGPFESPQNFNRINLFTKYIKNLASGDRVELTASHFTSRWDASGQIPQRAVDRGLITRFGAIDDTEGGDTSRTNFNISFQSILSENTTLTANAFYSNYTFELFSNFTFFLEDPINGDQIKQRENRDIYGINTKFNYNQNFSNFDLDLSYGFSLRHDVNNDVELSRTANRKTTLEVLQLGDINQTNTSAYVEAMLDFGKFKIQPGVRLDHFNFLYNDQLQENYETQSETETLLNPKLNLYYTINNDFQVYAKSGLGFHSNDARVVVANQGEEILPRSYNADLGLTWKPAPRLLVEGALWYLFLEQEFVYVGDAGIVEPSGKTRRYGIDLSARYQLNDWLFLNADATYTKARAIDELDGEDFIPLAPDFTLVSGLYFKDIKNFSGGLQMRYIDDRPANEDNTIIAEGYTVFDLNVSYEFNKLTLGVRVENLFDIDWNEAQFATESRLRNESASTEELHFTPGTPFYIRGIATYTF
ncbi:MAG: TonB-dependent receptor [Bacteroidota bacterium]|nr:TonB-dependent receptor [Bacteroidota bacterium]